MKRAHWHCVAKISDRAVMSPPFDTKGAAESRRDAMACQAWVIRCEMPRDPHRLATHCLAECDEVPVAGEALA